MPFGCGMHRHAGPGHGPGQACGARHHLGMPCRFHWVVLLGSIEPGVVPIGTTTTGGPITTQQSVSEDTQMHKRRRFLLDCEQLEPRIQLSALPVADLSVIYFSDFRNNRGAELTTANDTGSLPQIVVTGAMTISPAAPNDGTSFTCTLTTNNNNPMITISGTVWQYTILATDGTTTVQTPWATQQLGDATTCGVTALIPGVYTIQATTTYASNNPMVQPPPPTVSTGQVTIPPPSLDTSLVPPTGYVAPLGSTTVCTASVSSSLGEIGQYAVGTMQELIPGFIPVWAPGQGLNSIGWFPPTIYDTVAPRTINYSTTPVGGIFDSWLQQLRVVVPVSGFSGGFGGTLGVDYLYYTLPPIGYVFVKSPGDTWTVYTNGG